MSVPEREPAQRPRRLVRTARGRLLGGVCSGLGEHFGVDPILFRIAFVGLAFLGGVGIGLYLAILLLVAEEGARRPPIRLRRSSWRNLVGGVAVLVAAWIGLRAASRAVLGSGWGFGLALGSIALVGIVATIVWSRLRTGDGESQRPSVDRRLARGLALVAAVAAGVSLLGVAGGWLAGTQRSLAAWLVVGIGAVLVLAASRGVGWLVLPALAFAVSVAVVAAADVNLHGGVGDRTYRPQRLSDLRGSYALGAGRLELDLRDVAFPAGDTSLHLRMGVGEVVVLVPDAVCVATRAQIGGGYVGALDRQSGGLDVKWVNRPSSPPTVRRLVLYGRVGLGTLYVADRPFGGGWAGGGGGGFRPGAYGTNDACRQPVGARR